MHRATKIILVLPLALCVAGCGTSMGAWHVGAGLLAGGAAVWSAKAQADSVKLQRENLQLQTENMRLQVLATQSTIRLNDTQRRYYEEQRLQAVATRETECSNYVYAMNVFSATICAGLNKISVCSRVYAAAKRSPAVCLPTLRQAGYRI